jgi:hypothetical protein
MDFTLNFAVYVDGIPVEPEGTFDETVPFADQNVGIISEVAVSSSATHTVQVEWSVNGGPRACWAASMVSWCRT